MKIKHIVIMLIWLLTLYGDYRFFVYSYNEYYNTNYPGHKDPYICWCLLHIIFFIIALCFFITYLQQKTYFFETCRKILNKKIL